MWTRNLRLVGISWCSVLLLSIITTGQENGRITGKVVDKNNNSVGGVKIWLRRGAETLTGVSSDGSGNYSAEYLRGSPIDVIYDCSLCTKLGSADVLGISGQSNHSITKVLPPRRTGGQQLSQSEARELIETAEYFETYSSTFMYQLISQYEAIKNSSVPEEFGARAQHLFATAQQLQRTIAWREALVARFQGDWRLDKTRSDIPLGGDLHVKILRDKHGMLVRFYTQSSKPPWLIPAVKEIYKLDGTETAHVIHPIDPSFIGESILVSYKANWEGTSPTLAAVFKSTRRELRVAKHDRWELSDGGETLTVRSTVDTSQSKREHTLVFAKVSPAAAR